MVLFSLPGSGREETREIESREWWVVQHVTRPYGGPFWQSGQRSGHVILRASPALWWAFIHFFFVLPLMRDASTRPSLSILDISWRLFSPWGYTERQAEQSGLGADLRFVGLWPWMPPTSMWPWSPGAGVWFPAAAE